MNETSHRLCSALIAACLVTVGQHVWADPVAGQIDTFQSGTALGWFTGGGPSNIPPTPPAIVSTGGPGGAGDAFMSLISLGGAGPRSRLTVANATQWAGNYTAAGVTLIEMDVNNRGTNDLSLRLGVADTSASGPVNIAASTNAVFVPAGSGWMHLTFPIAIGDLTAILGDANVALTTAATLHLYHSPTVNFPNPISPIPAIVADLGVDNVRAVPEPSALLICAGSTMFLAKRRLRRLRVTPAC